jgi:hypothetical protein
MLRVLARRFWLYTLSLYLLKGRAVRNIPRGFQLCSAQMDCHEDRLCSPALCDQPFKAMLLGRSDEFRNWRNQAFG